jgi:hypothetical protein
MVPTSLGELEMRSMAHRTYHTLRKAGIRWAMWRPVAGQAPVGQTSSDTVTDATERIDARSHDVTERPGRAVRTALALATRRASAGLTRVTPRVLPLAAMLAVGVVVFVTIPLVGVLLAGSGAGGAMLLRRRMLR